MVKKLPTNPIPTPRAIPTGSNVLYTVVTGRNMMMLFRRLNLAIIYDTALSYMKNTLSAEVADIRDR